MKLLKNPYLFLITIHVVIGFAIYAFRPFAKFYFVASIGIFLFYLFKNGNKNNEALYAAAYVTGAEVLFRMTDASPIPVYEAGKYGVIGFILLGLFFSGTSRKSGPYWLYLLLLIPGIIYASSTLDYGTDFRKAVIFNLSGPFCLGIAALYCVDRKITRKQLQYVLWSLLMPTVAMGVYLFFYTPDTRDILSGTGSNYAASGGFGPNQVATAIGIGMFCLVVQLFMNSKNVIMLAVNLGLLSLLTYRGIVTFSRGGVLTALIISVAFILFYFKAVNIKKKKRILGPILFLVLTASFTYLLTSVRTSGLIDKRYANKDAAGRIKEDLSTGRKELISSELEAFFDNPLTGIGVGKIKEYREETEGISAASHNELSRMLSEHGLSGLLALIILGVYPLIYRLANRRNFLFFSMLGFWFLTINHSSMRIAAPAFIYSLCLLNIVNEKKKSPIHRERINA
ncbi:O-antigen ligase family protein [uncultured Dokdonia sp.]|uniref:O-antigen ligase family protein n=1 Tax=uncultured Dokdonia sp. TaxID=575653 RepID=UPI002604ED8F|nr:O-antigen ligase family protein [uncultured Dokdonia sp.]